MLITLTAVIVHERIMQSFQCIKAIVSEGILVTITNLVRRSIISTLSVMIFEYCLNRCGQLLCPVCLILTPCQKLDTYICVSCNPQDEPVPRSKRTVDQSKTCCLLHLHVDYLFFQRFGSTEAVVAQVNLKFNMHRSFNSNATLIL